MGGSLGLLWLCSPKFALGLLDPSTLHLWCLLKRMEKNANMIVKSSTINGIPRPRPILAPDDRISWLDAQSSDTVAVIE